MGGKWWPHVGKPGGMGGKSSSVPMWNTRFMPIRMWNRKWQWNSQKPAKKKCRKGSIGLVVELVDVRVPQSLTWVIGSESQHHVTVVGHRHCVLKRRWSELAMQQTASIQVERVLQVDLFHIGVRRATHSDHMERRAVQMERMAQVRLLDCWRDRDIFTTL